MLNPEDFLSAAPTILPYKIKSGELSNEEFARNFAQFLLAYKSIKISDKVITFGRELAESDYLSTPYGCCRPVTGMSDALPTGIARNPTGVNT
jgi:hypothetical protein